MKWSSFLNQLSLNGWRLTLGAWDQRDGRREPQEPEVGETQGGGEQQRRRFLDQSIQGSSINDVTHFWIIFDPPSRIVTLFSTVVTKIYVTISPLEPRRHLWTTYYLKQFWIIKIYSKIVVVYHLLHEFEIFGLLMIWRKIVIKSPKIRDR